MKNLIRLLLLLTASIVAACKSSSPSQYISPRIEGRVVDGITHQPVVDVRVQPASANEAYRSQQVKGGELIARAPVVRSEEDGTFALASERAVAVFRTLGWYSINVSFAHPSYQPLTVRYTLTDATNTPAGEPLIRAGDILLVPLSR
jgi:hypothetical protein